MESVLLRCNSCGTINKVAVLNLDHNLKCGNCKAALDYPKLPVNVSFSNFHNEVIHWPGVVLVDFWSNTCVHCMHLSPVLDQLANEKAGRLKIAKINTESEPNLTMQFGIQGVPTLILFQNGKIIDKIPGALPKQQLESWLNMSTGV